jgi:hypothetical protein
MDPVLKTGTNLVVAGAILGGVLLLLLPRDFAFRLTREDGLIENLSVLAAACAVIIAVVKLFVSRPALWLAIAIVPFYLMLRELDLQNAFTPRSIGSTGFYFHPDIPLLMKLTVVAALSPLACAGIYLVRAGLQELRTAGGPTAAWWRPLLCAGGLLAVARVSEKFLRPTGRIIEELFELAFVSLILLVIVTQALRRADETRIASHTPDQPGPGNPD